MSTSLKTKKIFFLVDFITSLLILASSLIFYSIFPNDKIINLGDQGNISCEIVNGGCLPVNKYINGIELSMYTLWFGVFYAFVTFAIYVFIFKYFSRIKYFLITIFTNIFFGGVFVTMAAGSGLGGTSNWNILAWLIYYTSFGLTFSIYPLFHFYMLFKYFKELKLN